MRICVAFTLLILSLPAEARLPSREEVFVALRNEALRQPPLSSWPRVQDDPLDIYYDDIKRRLIETAGSQKEPEHQQHKKLICRVTITPMGEIANLTIVESSGVSEIDNRAQELVKRAAPFARRDPHRTKKNNAFWVVFFDYPNDDLLKVYVKSAPKHALKHS